MERAKMERKLLGVQVEDALMDYILNTPVQIGEKLPNEFELGEMFQVGRSTVREAVKSLVTKGILEVRRGECYALIGENYMPSVTVTGFSQVSGQGDVSSLVIGENADQNVFVLHFDRRSYTILFNTNLPDGTSESESATYVYGETIDLNEREVPQVDANYRYFGWAEFPGAEPS